MSGVARPTGLELYGIIQDQNAWQRLETVARRGIEELFERYKDHIAALPTSKREEYNRIRRRSKEPQTVSLMFPDTIEVTREESPWNHHLYVDENERFGWNANTWEVAVLKAEMERDGFVAWLRNFPRKPWSFCVPYLRRGEDRPLHPDLIVFRREKGKLRVDLLDPHDSGRTDAVDKAVGLARYAARHGDSFGRIELIVVGSKGEIKRLDVNRESIREKVKQVGSDAHLDALYEGQA